MKEHKTDGTDCWCHPRIIKTDGADVIVHNYFGEWADGDTAPKDRTILAFVKGYAHPVIARWNILEGSWAYASVYGSMSADRGDYLYFANDFASKLLKWMPMPEGRE